MAIDLESLQTPTRGSIEDTIGSILARLDDAPSTDDVLACFERWENLRRDFATWKALVVLRLRQDSSDTANQAAAKDLATLGPLASHLDAEVKRRLLTSEHRNALVDRIGPFVIERWKADVANDDPNIADQLRTEQRLVDSYITLMASARTAFKGKEQSLGDLSSYAESADRSERESATRASWRLLDEHHIELDRIFNELVDCRTAIAGQIGARNFIEVAHRRLGRTDFDQHDIAVFRDEIAADIVPVVAHLLRSQARTIGVRQIMPWDDQVFDLGGSASVPRDTNSVVAAACAAFSALEPELGAFVASMAEGRLIDVEPRAGKASGAFCAFFPSLGTPFVFANLTGSSRDVLSFAHELGHAFQDHRSRNKPVMEYMVPTSEAGEIHGLALEFLLFPHFDMLFGLDADRCRIRHLRTMLGMLPFIAAIDHFQELVYEEPDATSDERAAMWEKVEHRYLPWRRGLEARAAPGRSWQRLRHVFAFPFYYIDYGLALCCALQLWSMSMSDAQGAVRTYLDLCSLGGELPFRDLLAVANLRSPFERGVLSDVVRTAIGELPS